MLNRMNRMTEVNPKKDMLGIVLSDFMVYFARLSYIFLYFIAFSL